jgi:hypothetical protein
MRTTIKWSRRLALLAAPLAVVAGLVLPGTAAWAWNDSVVFAVQPTTTQVNGVMTPAVVVQVDQSDGQVDQSYNGPVTLTYAVNQIGAPEPANNTVNADQGVATFSGLTFSAVGFGFELQASISGNIDSATSAPFDIVTQQLQCSPGQTCQSETVSSAGTSGFVTAATEQSNVLTATGGGFPQLSCTSFGGVVSFSVQNGSKIITVILDKSTIQSGQSAQSANWKHHKHFAICWGSSTPFTTANGTTSVFNSANNEYEGLLPLCRAHGGTQPCILRQYQIRHLHKDGNKHKHDCGFVVTKIAAPLGDPHISY